MSIKKKLGLGAASAALGLSLIGGGTYAYFNDTAIQNNTFATGTLDLSVDPTTVVDVTNLKPGDWMKRNFRLTNEGSLDIKKVLLHTAYTVTKNDGTAVSNPLANQFADAIEVEFLCNIGEIPGIADYKVIDSKTLLQLRDMTPEDLAKEWEMKIRPWHVDWFLVDGIKAGNGIDSNDKFFVKFKFKDTGVPQNELQDLKLNLKWTFEGMQEDGEER